MAQRPSPPTGTQLTKLLSEQEAARAPTRRMTVIAQDPGVRRDGRIVMSTIEVPAEDLRVGPMGYRVQVVDFDATRRVFHRSHNLPARSPGSRKRGVRAGRKFNEIFGSTRRTRTRW